MRYTLLEMTQSILDAMGSDEVNSINDTDESISVSKIIKENYFNIITEIQPKETEGLFHLDPSLDTSSPTLMYMPSHVSNIEWLKYNVGDSISSADFRELCYLDLEVFLERNNGLDEGQSWVSSQSVDIMGQEFFVKYRNDSHPSHWTSIDDRIILFDSFDATVEDTLTSSRTYGYGGLIPEFSMDDNFIPKLDARQFQLLLNSAKAQAFAEIKQAENADAAYKARRNKILAVKTQDNTDNRTELRKYKGYGR